jgi:hypothetical protein
MRIQALAGAAVWVVLAGTATADPGELVASRGGGDAGPLQVLDSAPACNLKSGLCLSAGAASTVAVASAPVASAIADSSSAKQAPVVPRFERAASSDGAPWTLTFAANLKKPALRGNALFVFFDLEDRGSIENREYTALYQAPLKPGPKVAARVALAPDEGFHAGHTYRIRVIQLINNKEVVLTEGDVALQ